MKGVVIVHWGHLREHRLQSQPGRRQDRSLCQTGCCPVLMRAGSTAPEMPDQSRPLCLRHTQLHSACRDRRKTGEPQFVPHYLISSEHNIKVCCNFCDHFTWIKTLLWDLKVIFFPHLLKSFLMSSSHDSWDESNHRIHQFSTFEYFILYSMQNNNRTHNCKIIN